MQLADQETVTACWRLRNTDAPERCNLVERTDDGRPVAERAGAETWFNACNYDEYSNVNQAIRVERVWETTDCIDAV